MMTNDRNKSRNDESRGEDDANDTDMLHVICQSVPSLSYDETTSNNISDLRRREISSRCR